ncbi:hypothetical protein FH039_00660 [Thermococcus indicus]|uniref:DUF8203 domain-containing protein n=1 Tax=Thermococcus indicus TaxID=2586643 RepID=A0A4Y5SKC3_9EURY|nr:hypothetical protein [Thermococcus indicus]QDA30420.1 hypothetical protein FH039_00660 [Thermococcus indicus]
MFIGSDEGDIKFIGKNGTFIARIGVAVSVRDSDFSEYVRSYREFFERFKSNFGLQTPRWVFSSSDLRSYLIGEGDLTEYLLLMREFIDDVVVPNNVITNFVFASFGVKRVYMPDGTSKSVMAFIKKVLKSYFAYIPAWVVVSRLSHARPKVHIDNFNPSPQTVAWNELLNRASELKIIPNGDKIDPLISTADLLLRYVKEMISLSKWRLDVNSLRTNLRSVGFPGDLLRIYHVGGRYLSNIVPQSVSNDIDPSMFNPTPRIYVLKEGLLTGEKEQQLIEKSPVFEYILRYATDKGGSLKFLSLQAGAGGDFDMLKQGGIVISLGPYGEKLGEYISSGLGFPLTHLTSSELVMLYGGDQ